MPGNFIISIKKNDFTIIFKTITINIIIINSILIPHKTIITNIIKFIIANYIFFSTWAYTSYTVKNPFIIPKYLNTFRIFIRLMKIIDKYKPTGK